MFVLALTLGLDWVLGLGEARVCGPTLSPASLGVGAWFICVMEGGGRERCKRRATARDIGRSCVGFGGCLSDGFLLYL